jgi:hypothetical protein
MRLYFKTIPKKIKTSLLPKPHITNSIFLYASTGMYESDYRVIGSDGDIEEYTINNEIFIKDTSTYTKIKVYRIPFDHMKLEQQKYTYLISDILKLVIIYSNDTIYNIYFESEHIDSEVSLIKDTLIYINK